MSLDKTRFLRIFRDPRTFDELSAQFADLRHILFSALQEIEVLKKMLRERDFFDSTGYRQARMHVMIGDHSSQGPSPWKSHSQYPYTLDEMEFAREVLRLTPDEIEEFKKEAASMETMT